MKKRFTDKRLVVGIIVTAILLIPLMYSGLLTWAYQKPFDRLDRISAAVVNLDTPAQKEVPVGTPETIDLGTELVSRLTQPASGEEVGFEWHESSAAAAETGLADGTYLAVLYIPANASETLTREATPDAESVTLHLRTNDGINYLAGTIAKSVAENMQVTLMAEGSSRIADKLFLSFGEVKENLGKAATGAATLANGNAEIANGSAKLDEGAAELSRGAFTLADGTRTFRAKLGDLATGAAKLDTGVSTLAAKSKELAGGVHRIAEGAKLAQNGAGTLQRNLELAAAGTSSLRKGVNQYTTTVDQAMGALTDPKNLAKVTQLAEGVAALQQGAQQLQTAIGPATAQAPAPGQQPRNLNAALSALSNGAQQLQSGLGEVAELQGPANGAPDSVASAVHALQLGSQQLAVGWQNLSTGGAQLQTGINRAAQEMQQLQPELAKLSKLPTATAALDEGITGLDGSLKDYTGAVDQLAASCQVLGGNARLCDSLAQISEKSAALRAGSTKLANGAQQLAGATRVLSDPQLQEKLAATPQAMRQLSQGAEALQTALNQAGRGAERLAQGSTNLEAKLPAALVGATQLRDALEKVRTQSSQLADGSEKLAAGSAQLAAAVQPLQQKLPAFIAQAEAGVAASAQLREGAAELAEGSQKLAAGSQTLQGKLGELAAGAGRAANGAGQLQQGAQAAASGTQQVAQGAAQAVGGAVQLSGGAEKLADGTQNLKAGTSVLYGGAQKAESGASELAAKLAEGEETIPQWPENKVGQMAQAAATPVQVEAIRDHAVPTNGSGFAPMFMSLALWVGAIAIFLVFPALDFRRSEHEAWWSSATRCAVAATIMAVGQAVVAVAGMQLFVELGAKDLAYLFFVAVLASLTFTALNQFFIAAMAFRGRFVSVLLLILQIAAMGATFPIETTSSFLQGISRILPMTYVARSIRTSIAGAGYPLGPTLVMCALWGGLGIVGTLVAAKLRTAPKSLPTDPAQAPS